MANLLPSRVCFCSFFPRRHSFQRDDVYRCEKEPQRPIPIDKCLSGWYEIDFESALTNQHTQQNVLEKHKYAPGKCSLYAWTHASYAENHFRPKHTKVLGLCQQPSFLSNLLSFWEAIHQKILVLGGFHSQNLGGVRWVYSQDDEFYGFSLHQMKQLNNYRPWKSHIGELPNIQCSVSCQASACSRMINVNL